MRYIAKPVEVEAIRWLGNNTQEVLNFCGCGAYHVPRSCYMTISTLAGELRVTPGNYIVRNINSNEYYVYRAQQFQNMYEPIEENEDGD